MLPKGLLLLHSRAFLPFTTAHPSHPSTVLAVYNLTFPSNCAERAGAPQPTEMTEHALRVVIFKKLGYNVPTGITSKSLSIFLGQFLFSL
jgi:hypothetical protein